MDCDTDEYVVDNKSVSKTSYIITGSKLTSGHRYEISLTTYLDSVAIGKTDKVYFDVLNDDKEDKSKDATREAEFIRPKNNDVIDSEKALELTWSESDIETYYSLTVEDLTADEYLVKNKITNDTEYTIEAYDLYAGHKYTAKIKTYNNTSSDKEIIGSGDEIKFETKSEPDEDDNKAPEDYYDVSLSHPNYEAIKYLSDISVLNGYDDGSFKPDNSITRAEFVKVVCEAFGIKSYGSAGVPSFTDIYGHWAADYIKYAASRNIINGMGDGIFAPNSNVTYQHIAKIIVVLKSMDGKVDELGGYPTGYLKVTYYNGFFNNTNVGEDTLQSDSFYAKNATRADVAQIVYNVLNHDGRDRTPSDDSPVSQVAYDIGNAYANPTPQQIYNLVYCRLKDREVYEIAPEVVDAVMTMIWAENGGVHYDKDGDVVVSSTNDYGICQLNGNKYKNLNWHENAEIGIDKYAVAYYSCITNSVYKDTVNKGVVKGVALDESRARTAYCMYNGGNGAHDRWVFSPIEQDKNFKSKWDSKAWKTLLDVVYDSKVNDTQISQLKLIDRLREDEIYIKQATSTTCTLASMVMVFRRRAILDDNENWWTIREDTMKKQGNWPDGLSASTQYVDNECDLELKGSRKRINYSTDSSGNPILKSSANTENTINIIKGYLDEHPEGIVFYVMESGGGWKHAVTLIRYDGDEFYCADPASSKYAGRELNLMESSLVDSSHANTQNIESLFSNCIAVWYVTSH